MLKIFSLVEAAGGLVEHQKGRFCLFIEIINGIYPREKLKKRILDRWSSQRSYGGNWSKGFNCKKKPNHTFHLFSRNGKYKLKKLLVFNDHFLR